MVSFMGKTERVSNLPADHLCYSCDAPLILIGTLLSQSASPFSVQSLIQRQCRVVWSKNISFPNFL